MITSGAPIRILHGRIIFPVELAGRKRRRERHDIFAHPRLPVGVVSIDNFVAREVRKAQEMLLLLPPPLVIFDRPARPVMPMPAPMLARPPRIIVPLKRGLDRVEAAAYIGIGTTMFDRLVRDGRMPAPIHVDGRRIWDIKAIDSAFDALSGHDGGISANPWDEP